MRNVLRPIAVAAFALALAGCAQNAVYFPAIVNAPQLAKQGDVSVALHGSPIQGQANGGVAVTNHLAVRFAGDYRIGSDQPSSHSADLGIGYFVRQSGAEEPGAEGPRGFYEGISVDAGMGESNDLLSNATIAIGENMGDPTLVGYDSVRYQTRFTRAALQGEAGYRFEKFSITAVARYTGVHGTLGTRAQDVGQPEQRRSEDVDWRLAEAAIVTRTRLIEHLNFETQLGGSVPVNRTGPIATDAGLWPIIFAVGLEASF